MVFVPQTHSEKLAAMRGWVGGLEKVEGEKEEERG